MNSGRGVCQLHDTLFEVATKTSIQCFDDYGREISKQKIKADELPVPYRTKSNQKTISVINYYWYRVRMKKRSLRLKMSMTREMKAFGNRSINLRAKPEMKLTVCITAPSTTGHGISV